MNLKADTNNVLLDFGTHWLLNGKRTKPTSDLHLAENTTLEYFTAYKDSVNHQITFHLDEPGATTHIRGAIFLSQNSQVELSSCIAHHAPNTHGHCLIKGIATDSANIKLSGMIRIDQTANNSTDQLTERLLLLSTEARGELQPELEILTNEVKASHATTIAHLDELEMFYLQSRGLNKNQAEQLMIRGFLEDAIKFLDEESGSIVRKHLNI